MRSIIKISSIVILILVLASCTDKRNRQVQYMGDTDMYVPVSYETYSANPLLKDGMSAQLPVEGTIARGKVPYDYPNNEEGYQMAKDSLISSIEVNDANLAKGKYLYGIYCATCHGLSGDGQGDLVKNEKFLGVFSISDFDYGD